MFSFHPPQGVITRTVETAGRDACPQGGSPGTSRTHNFSADSVCASRPRSIGRICTGYSLKNTGHGNGAVGRLERIFEPFFRPTKNLEKGKLAWGLATVTVCVFGKQRREAASGGFPLLEKGTRFEVSSRVCKDSEDHVPGCDRAALHLGA